MDGMRRFGENTLTGKSSMDNWNAPMKSRLSLSHSERRNIAQDPPASNPVSTFSTNTLELLVVSKDADSFCRMFAILSSGSIFITPAVVSFSDVGAAVQLDTDCLRRFFECRHVPSWYSIFSCVISLVTLTTSSRFSCRNSTCMQFLIMIGPLIRNGYIIHIV